MAPPFTSWLQYNVPYVAIYCDLSLAIMFGRHVARDSTADKRFCSSFFCFRVYTVLLLARVIVRSRGY